MSDGSSLYQTRKIKSVPKSVEENSWLIERLSVRIREIATGCGPQSRRSLFPLTASLSPCLTTNTTTRTKAPSTIHPQVFPPFSPQFTAALTLGHEQDPLREVTASPMADRADIIPNSPHRRTSRAVTPNMAVTLPNPVHRWSTCKSFHSVRASDRPCVGHSSYDAQPTGAKRRRRLYGMLGGALVLLLPRRCVRWRAAF